MDEVKTKKAENAEVKEVKTKKAENKPKKYLVETPVKNFSGIVAGVHFAYGKAEVYEGHILNWFKRKGYKVTAL